MSLDNSKLLDFLSEIDKELTRKITVVAVGGTVMTLLKAKASTRDVDFTIPSEFYDDFQNALKIVTHGFEVQCWHDGAVFITMLPEDYLKKSSIIKTKMKNLELRALHPIDIVVTKISRLNDRDIEDIESCIKKFHLKKKEIEKRAKQIAYPANEESYKINLQLVIQKFFKK